MPPHQWAVGYTCEFTLPLPGPANSGNRHKTKQKQAETPLRKSSASTRLRKPSPEVRKPESHTKPDSASVEAKKQKRAEYDQQRNQTPERKEYHQRLAQARQRKAKDLGKYRQCSKQAIPGQTRCETCAEKHRQSRRHSDAKRNPSTVE